MAAADRIAGVICIGFAALLKVLGTIATGLALQIERSGMTIAHPHGVSYTHMHPDMSSGGPWYAILLILGVVFITKSIVTEICRGVRFNTKVRRLFHLFIHRF